MTDINEAGLFLLGLGIGGAIERWIVPRIHPHRHTWKHTGWWAPMMQLDDRVSVNWYQQKCTCKAMRIITSNYEEHPWDDADEAMLRHGVRWKFDRRIQEVGDIVEDLLRG